MSEPTLWDRVDEPVLRWVATLPSSLSMEIHDFAIRDPEPFAAIPGLSSRDVHESLQRLHSHGLIAGEAGPPMPTTDWSKLRVTWSKLRVTASGWMVLGEWPDLDRVATAAAVHRLLEALADQAPEHERTALRRAAGSVARNTDEVIRGIALDVARTVGRESIE